MKLFSSLVIAAVLAAAAPAVAQGLYIVKPPVTATAPTYTGWTSFDFEDTTSSPPVSDPDLGVKVLSFPAGFSFNFFGKAFTKVTASADGLLIFENGPAGSPVCDGTSNSACYPTSMPDSAAPNGLIGYWWNDMVLNGTAASTTSGTAPDRVFSIKLTGWEFYDLFGSISPRTVQIDLYERTSAIKVYYGAITVGTPLFPEAAVVGIEDNTGATALLGLPCSNTSARCNDSKWPTGKMIEYGPAIDPDLTVLNVTGGALTPTTVNGNPGFSMDLQTTIKNQGQNPATGFTYDVYLSSDTTIDPLTDKKIASHAALETLAGYAQAVYTETAVSFEKPPVGEFYIGVYVDPPTTAKPLGNVVEALETNNTGVSLAYVSGADLSGEISGPASSGGGEPVNLHVIVHNSGTDPAGTFRYIVWLSADKTLDPATDKKFFTGSTTLSGGQTYDQVVAATLPNVADGSWYFLLEIDPVTATKPVGDVIEADETNNLAVSAAPIVTSAADLIVENISVRSTVPPYDPVTQAFFGEPVRVSFKLTNIGGATAKNFDVTLLLSDNAVITLHDIDITPAGRGFTGLSYVAAESHTFDVDLVVPTVSGATPLTEAEFYFGVIADSSSQVAESNEANNIGRGVNPVRLRQPAMDLTVGRIDAPLRAGTGEIVPVFRVLRNLGNRGNLAGGAAFDYRYVLSANDAITVQDLPLQIVTAGGPIPLGHGRLAPGSQDDATDLVRIPEGISPGTYYIGLIVDPDNALAELDETNNALSTNGPVELSSSGLTILATTLPDGLVGTPYDVELGARGGDGTYAFSLEPGQGELPTGLTLTPGGVIAGLPRTCLGVSACAVPGDAAFTVAVRSGKQLARARFVLRTVIPSGGFALLSAALPVAVRNRDYSAPLAAVGGARPYSYALTAGDSLPAGFSLSQGGVVSGRSPSSFATATFGITVTDAHGLTASGNVTMRVIDEATLFINTTSLLDAHIGIPYTQTLVAIGGKPPYTWSVSAGSLPEGVRITGTALTGVPSRTGIFPVTLQVKDSAGGTNASTYLLTVRPAQTAFSSRPLPEGHPGEAYSSDLSAGATPSARFALVGGELPEGVTLDGRGLIAGTVAATVSPRSFDFSITVTESTGSATVVPLTLRIVAPEVEAPKAAASTGCGCAASSSAGAMPLFGLVALLGMVMPRRRRSA